MPSEAVWRATANVRACQVRLDEALSDLERALTETDARVASHGPVEAIAAAVAEYFGISVAEVIGPRTLAYLLPARRLAMYLVRHLPGYTWSRVGNAFQRDHTTAISAVRQVEKLLAAGDEPTCMALKAVQQRLTPSRHLLS
jgi:chromosomal replication initiator protein